MSRRVDAPPKANLSRATCRAFTALGIVISLPRVAEASDSERAAVHSREAATRLLIFSLGIVSSRVIKLYDRI